MTWQILINDFLGGFAPAYYKEGYPSYGNKNQAGSMLNADLTDPGGVKQGPGLSTLTNGTQAGVVTTLINSILDQAITNDATYGVGGAKLYKISSLAVASDATWPHTIDKGTVTGESGEDVCYYKGVLYYSYNHSGSAGDIGTYDLASTFDDDWGSTVPTGKAALTSNPHQMVVGGNDIMYVANGRYVGSWNGTTYAPQQLSLPVGTIVKSIGWASDRLYIAANVPGLTGTNKNKSSIFIWDGASANWDTEIRVMGEIGGIHIKNGIVFFFYRDISSLGGYKLAYLNGTTVTDVCNYSGGLPTYPQITDYKDFIVWNSTSLNALWSYSTYPWQLTSPWTTTTGDDLLYAWGSGDKDLPVRFFQLADSGYTTAGAISCPFGTPMVASNETTNYKLAQFSGYDVNSNWKSLVFDMAGAGRYTKITSIKFDFDQLSTGARVDWTLRDNTGKIIYSDVISYDKLGGVSGQDYFLNGLVVSNARLELDWTNGSTSNTVKIRGVKIYGTNN